MSTENNVPDWMETFRTNLRTIRRRLRVSQRELANRTGLHSQGISNLENGHRPGITITTANRIARGLGVKLDVLMGTGAVRPRVGKSKRIPS